MSPQQTIAHYRILSKIGEGGMGAVYRAADTKLNRDVAIKVLPDAFAADANRMARFEREAQVLAALNHPNIAAIYGVEQGALIMELVEGDDLKGPVPIETAVHYARQIAAGLEAAHEKGIVHRDLKPANIKVNPDGAVKLLDFGLARATEEAAPVSSASPTMSPTLSLAMTQAGMILGTAAYMSPEQARGKVVDKRADIWAFGVVLFELLTGGMLFGGETVSDSMAAVITREPDWSLLPSGTPRHVRGLLMRCLRRDPKLRLRDIGEARILLDEAAAAPEEQVDAAAPKRSVLPWAVAAGVSAAALVLAFLLYRATRPVEHSPLRFSADMGPEAVAGPNISAAISPDGTRLAFLVQDGKGTVSLATRLMDQTKPTVLSGTEAAQAPFFSPDGQWIVFAARGQVKKVSIQGGAPVILCDRSGIRGADWDEDGNIVLGFNNTDGLGTAPAAGGSGPPRIFAKFANGDTSQRWPQILPGGDILFSGNHSGGQVEVLLRKTGQVKVVQRNGHFGRYVPSGHLIFVHQSTLFAVPFDLGRYETRGLPVPVLEDVAGDIQGGGGQLSVSRNGILVYLSGNANSGARDLFWFDAAGKKDRLIAAPASIRTPRLSPDGKMLAYSSDGDILVFDLARGATTRITNDSAAANDYPVWTPDGRNVVYRSVAGGIWWVRADGSGRPVLLFDSKGQGAVTGSISPDGRYVAFEQGGQLRDLWVLPIDASDPDHPKVSPPELFLATKGNDFEPEFSPDGHWLAYASDASGPPHIFVRPFPEGAKGGGQVQISTVPARSSRWSRTAREILYETFDGHIMAVPYTVNGRSFEAGKPRAWSAAQLISATMNPLYLWDLAPDGKRAFGAFGSEGGEPKTNLHLTFILNFFDYLKARAPVR